MAVSVTLQLTEDQHAALAWEAASFNVEPAQRLCVVLQPTLDECVRRYHDTQWHVRRRTLERDAGLAALVDRAGGS